jgi:amino acid adenylation domain-containing protein
MSIETPAGLSEAKQKLLAAMLERRLAGAAAPAAPPPPAAVPVDDTGAELPLSFAQRRLWFVDRLDPGNPTYNVHSALRLSGPLNAAALERALGGLVARHAALRTVFAQRDGEPVQVARPVGAFVLPVDALDALPDGEREAEAARRAGAETAVPFDLETGPLFRARLLRLADQEHWLLLTMHHIVTDAWSMGVLARDLSAMYDAFARGQADPLAPPGARFGDHVRWQRAHLTGAVLDEKLAYWRDALAGAPALLDLPTDRPRPAAMGHHGDSRAIVLPPELADSLRALAGAEGATLFMVLLATFQLLMSRYSGDTDVVIGSPIAGRTRAEDEELVGLLLNTLALRGDLSGDPTFRALVGQARDRTFAAYQHQELPFERLVEELAPERTLAHTAIFQVMLSLQNVPRGVTGLTGLQMQRIPQPLHTTKYDLALHATETAAGLQLQLVYRTELFDASTIDRMLGHLRALLEQGAADPGRRLSALRLLDDAERRRVLVEWNDADAAEPRPRLLHDFFADCVAATPDAVALVDGDAGPTYAELDARSSRLAHHLRALGVGPEARVGICLERGAALVTAVLGVFKAGGAYVALDPDHPPARIAGVLDDSGAALVLTDSRLAGRVDGTAARVVVLDRAADEIARHPATAPESGVRPESLAYVIYTSGSTGRPKGVLGTHGQAAAYLQAAVDAYGLRGCASVLHRASFVVDPWLREVFGAFAAGARLVLLPHDSGADPHALLRRIADHGVEGVWAIVPAYLEEVVRAAEEGGVVCPSLRTLLLAGEALPLALARRARRVFPNARVVNQYGPTETTMTATYHAADVDGAGKAGIVPLGRPLPGMRVYVLDSAMQPVPAGLPGEAYLGGARVTRGYAARPALTAERFVPDPFGRPGARLYRTGDRARWRADGELEFLGRMDHQVKIRGFRVEPGEVEAALRAHPTVRQAVVVARTEGGTTRLAAYVTAAEGAPPAAGELRAALEASLPAHLVPAAFVVLDSFPLTPGGKIDRRRLPAPEYAADGEFVAPRTPTEELLAGVWTEVLPAARVGVHDNFFAVGGHSLLATRVLSRVREVCGAELPLRALFEAPTVAALAERVDAARDGASADASAPIPAADRTRPLPLSMEQQRLWFLDRLEPGTAAYNMPRALRLTGALDADALERALAELVRRHQVLRTVFAEHDGDPVQVVRPAEDFVLAREDLGPVDAGRRGAAVEERAAAEGRASFDLARGPLFRAVLLRLADDEHVLLLTLHHVAGDAWSMGVLFRELGVLYEAFAGGLPSPLAPLAVQYADYAVWQRGRLTGEALESRLAWWRDQLRGAPALLELPTDRPRPPVQGSRGGRAVLELPPELLERLRALGRREGATLYMVLLAAFQTLLARHSGQTDVVVGSPIAGRTRRELEDVIGFFLNTLAMRADLSGDPTFRALLSQVRERTLGAHQHQDLPFDRLVEELGVERSLAHSPVFQVMLVFQNAPRGAVSMRGLRMEPVALRGGAAKYDLTLYVNEIPTGLNLQAIYRADLFDAETMDRMLGHLRALLEQVADDPARRLSSLELMDADERGALRAMMDGGAADFPRGLCLHQLFADRAARMPDAVALVHAGETMTFAELDARANRLAHYLVSRGVRPESRVGICLPRGIDLVVGILGVMKAGGAYIPLDPGYPAERLSYMLADSGARLVLTASNVADRVADSAAEAVRVDEIRAELASCTSDAPVTAVDPSNLAYVVYTSGSTGKPKGVATPHRGVISYMMHLQCDYGISMDDTIVPLAALSFDASVRELLGSLCAGAHIVFTDEDERMDPPRLLARLRNEPVTAIMAIVPSLLRALVDAAEGEGSTVDTLRLILASGEALPGELARRALAVFPNAKLVNQWGATEATLSMTRYFAPKDAGEETLSLGGPIANMRAYVLDDALRAVPVGVAGEAYLGGVGITRGYVDQPALTAERFLPDPFSTEPGARMYRNGDRVRWRHDGTLEFLGRTDHQIKIRGVRIEPAEVEAALLAHDSVREAIVVAREDGGEKRLVAYVTPANGLAPSPTELRASLEARLPAFMVPSAVVVLDAMPLSPNGKIDRKQLPAPEFAAAEDAYVAPSTPAEEVIAGIWGEVLAAARVGAHDNFFALGGHSLLATRVVSRLRDAFGVEVSLRALFEAPTVAGLAERVEAARRGEGAVSLPAIQPVDRAQPLPLSFAQQRLWFLDRLEPGSTLYGMPRVLRLRGTLDAAALERALAEIVRRHEVLRTTYEERGGTPVQVVHPTGDFVLRLEDLSTLPADDREESFRERIVAQSRMTFDLSCRPLFRAALVRLADDDHALLFSTHHIASDGWSMGVFSRDLSALYTAFAEGRPSPLAELAVQYADFAAWQREHLSGETLDAEVGWWKQRLAGAPALLELPTDRPRPAEQSYRGSRAFLRLPSELSDGLKALARREGATPFMVLLAAFQLLLSRYSGQQDVVVGSPIAGRTRREVEGLIGCFVNTLALRADLSGDPEFRELLARVRRTTLEAYEHQDVPFEKLVEELAPERTLAHHPLFQVALTMQNAAGSVLRLPGLALEVPPVERRTAKFDLELTWFDNADGLAASLEYATDLFDAATAERMLAHLRTLLQAIVSEPSRRLSRLSLVDADERRVLDAWNPAPVALPEDVSTQEMFEAQVARTPNAVALSCGAERVTYDALNRRANRVARALVAEGVGPEVVVPVLAERGIAYWVNVLGVMKAGGAFLPLDPNHPARRWTQVLEQSRASIVLVQDSLECALRDGTVEMGDAQPRLVVIESLAERVDDDGNVPVRIVPGNLAYLIFTSGSTGNPKGAMLEHGGMFNHLHAKNIDLGITSVDVVGQNASQCFDISIWQFLSPLLVGATVEVMPDRVANDPALLVETMDSRGVTVLETVPSLMQLMVEELKRERANPLRLASLRWLIPNGEVLPPELARTWLRMYPHAHIINAYGATETSDDVTHCKLLAPPAEDVRQIGIGGHLVNARLHILDRHLQPVPAGVPGELYIAGVQVGRGYTFDPKRTASSFIPDPFAADAGVRMYRTGDRVRLRLDGELEFLGRVDHQVKLRGLRIELGEIEAVIRQHPAVRESVVLVREDALVGYVVPSDLSSGISTIDLRLALKERLPEYMVPASFVVLDEMPLNANGKADRKALPAPERTEAADAYVAPRTPEEELIAGILADLLRLERVGAEDDFFTLGGHSLMAMRLVTRVREARQVELPLRTIFETPTVAALAAAVAASAATAAPALAPIAIIPAASDDDLLAHMDEMSEEELDALLGSLGEEEAYEADFA